MFVVDTNLLLYAVNPDAHEHKQARTLIERWRREDRPWFITWGIAYEFIRVSTHARVFPKPLTLLTACEWIHGLIASPPVDILVETERHGAVLSELMRIHPRVSGNLVHDLHTAALMREHGVSEIRTADSDFFQFRFIDTVNPLR